MSVTIDGIHLWVPASWADAPWRALARCKGMDPNWFFPSRGQSTEPQRQFCAECPVQAECLNYALDHETEGWWGGTSARERRRMRTRMLAAKSTPPRKMGMPRKNSHGTEYAYKTCGPPKCDACKAARREAAIRRGELTGNGHIRTGDGNAREGRYSGV